MFAIALLGLLGIGLVVDLIGSDDDDDQETAGVEDRVTIESESGTTIGTNETDIIAGGDGENRVFGRDGNDFIAGGEADDQLFGGDGSDFILGEAGDDLIRGGAGDDLLVAGEGNDTLYGDTGNDTLVSEDTLDDAALINSVRTGTEPVFNYSDDEVAEGDTLFGGSGNDVFYVGGDDVVNTGSGDDIVSTGFWMEAGEQAIVTDFVQGEDALVYNYDQSQPEPIVSFSENADNDAQFLINGDVVMVLTNVEYTTLSTSDVRLFAI